MIKDFLKGMNALPKLGKLLLCLPVVDILWAVYRILGAVEKKDVFKLILGIIWIFAGAAIFWILDLVCVILYGHICWWQE